MPSWDALFEIFLILRVPLGAAGALFWLKKATFLGSDFLMIFRCDRWVHLGGVGGRGEARKAKAYILI